MNKNLTPKFDVGLADKPLHGRRILIIVENLPVPFDRRVWQEARTLKKAGAEVTVICPMAGQWTEPHEVIDGVHIYRHPLNTDGRGAIGYLKEYAAALYWQTKLSWQIWWKHGFDVIQGCNPPDLVFLVAIQFKIFGKRYIFDHHDINPELYEAKFGKRGIFWYLLKIAERLNFAAADVVISTNESYRQIALTRGRKHPEKVFVVRSGPDLNRLIAVDPNTKWHNGRNYMVGYVGVMGEQEGIDLLLDAIAHLVRAKGRYDIQFVLVGGGPLLQRMRSLSKSMDLQEYVTFTGRVPDDLLFEVLSSADVCVNPDRMNAMNDKSTMNKVLEYMAFSRPVVQFDVTEGRYSADDASLYAKPNDPLDFADKIEEVLDNPVLRKKMAAIGLKRIKTQFSWGHQIPHLLTAYLTVFQNR